MSYRRVDDGSIRYKYVWRLHAVLLPDGTTLKCAYDGKNVCATLHKASKAAEALEEIDGLRMVAYACPATNSYHVARVPRQFQRDTSDQVCAANR